MKKVLIVASVISFIEWFNRDNIKYLNETSGCEVHIACNTDYMEDTDIDRTTEYLTQLKNRGIILHNICFAREPFDKSNLSAFYQLKELIDKEHFSMIHCHTPVASIMARIASAKARKSGTQVLYTAHGFHFFKGAPKKNWLLFYPIEKICSCFTDVLITITREDFEFSRRRMKAKRTEYVPGVGVEIKSFSEPEDAGILREEIGISRDAFAVLSVGELNQNKNHETVIRAIAATGKDDIVYIIAGKGEKSEYLKSLAESLNVRLILLGYRNDVSRILNAADVFALPSHREGLSKALIEAMAAGLPCVVSKTRGNVDLIDEKGGFLCRSDDVTSFAQAVDKLTASKSEREKMGEHNRQKAQQFSKEAVNTLMFKIYDSVL